VISIFTSYDLPEYRKIAEEYGADHFVLKDAVSGAEIAAMVRAVIRKEKRDRWKTESKKGKSSQEKLR
jgi:DNA-binding NarL/FixJ family response regulator